MDIDDYVDNVEAGEGHSGSMVPIHHMPTNKVTTDIPFMFLGLGIIFVTVFGILGNALCGIVLSRQRLKGSYSLLALGLAIADSIYLFTKLLRYGIASAHEHAGTGYYYLNVFLPTVGPYLRAVTFTAHTASTYFTITIAIDRFLIVRWPAKAGKICTRNNAGLTTLYVLLWSLLFNITRWLEFRTVQQPGKEIYTMETTELRNDLEYRKYYIFWVYFVFMFTVPFITLSVLNTYILLGILRMKKINEPQTFTQQRDKSFSFMLIGVVVVFLVCNVDYLVLDILEYAKVKYDPFWNHLGNFLLTLNSAVNFLIYCVCGRKFRHELSKLMCEVVPCINQRGSHDIAAAEESQWTKDKDTVVEQLDLQAIH